MDIMELIVRILIAATGLAVCGLVVLNTARKLINLPVAGDPRRLEAITSGTQNGDEKQV